MGSAVISTEGLRGQENPIMDDPPFFESTVIEKLADEVDMDSG